MPLGYSYHMLFHYGTPKALEHCSLLLLTDTDVSPFATFFVSSGMLFWIISFFV